MKIKKRPFTLMEVLIAMVLTILVLMTLTFFYQQVVVIGTEIDAIKEKDFYTRYVESRLSDVLPKVIPPSDKDYAFFSFGDEGITKSGTQNLIFTFDNGISLDKLFANHAVGRLFVDREGHLILAYWPTPKQWDNDAAAPIKKEILMSGVESMELAFFIAPEKKETQNPNNQQDNQKANASKGAEGNNGKTPGQNPPGSQDKGNGKQEEKNKGTPKEGEKAPEPEPKGEWRVQPWLKDYKELPVLIKITIQLKGEKEKTMFMYPLANSKTHIIYD